MKHIFVINPLAGKGKVIEKIESDIVSSCEKAGVDYEIYKTQAARDGLKFVKERAQSGEEIRFYACGGDGTLFEVVNGAYGFENVQVAAVPLGSGNDFIRIFGKKEELVDIDAQINGTPIKIDAIKCADKIAINQCSMGVDAEICAKQAHFKKLLFVSGELAYTLSVFYCFMKKIKNEFTIRIDSGEPKKKTVLFCLAGNSRWYGGGYKGAPLALMDDGLLDAVIVNKNMNRLKILTLLNKYKHGDHIYIDITEYTRCKKIEIDSEKPAAVNIDGETEYVNHSCFEIVEKAINFVVPRNSTYIEDRKSGKISAGGVPEQVPFNRKGMKQLKRIKAQNSVK